MANKENKINQPADHGKVFFLWKFSEFTKHERGKNWYIIAGIVALLLLVYSAFSANLLFALVIIIFILVILMFQRNTDEVEFQIHEDGISVNRNFYDYKDIKNFFIIYEPPQVKTLYFEPKSLFSPRIPIPFKDQDPVKIREVLLGYLEEDLDQENEPLSDQISRLFKL